MFQLVLVFNLLKMRRFCGFWNSFGLSISGRVMAVKTYIMSQAIYFMGVIPLPDQKGIEMNDIITEYVRGGGRIIEVGEHYARNLAAMV